MKLRTLLAVAVAAATMGATAASAQQHKQLSIATGGTGGVYYPMGGGSGNPGSCMPARPGTPDSSRLARDLPAS